MIKKNFRYFWVPPHIHHENGGHLNPHPGYCQYKPINSIYKGLTISDQAQVTLQLAVFPIPCKYF